jgi:hypothetical protein
VIGLGTWFVIDDDTHAEPQGEFTTMDDAVAELRKRAGISWDQEPNRAPCKSWRTCGRVYDIIEYAEIRPWNGQLQRVRALQISAAGVKWSPKVRERYGIPPNSGTVGSCPLMGHGVAESPSSPFRGPSTH